MQIIQQIDTFKTEKVEGYSAGFTKLIFKRLPKLRKLWPT